MRGIDEHQKRLMQLFQFRNRLIFRIQIGFLRQIRKASVRRHNDADRRMVGDNFSCAQLCSLRKGNLVIVPRRFNQPFCTVLQMSCSALDHKAYAVHQTNADRNLSRKL